MFQIRCWSNEHKVWWDEFVNSNELITWNNVRTWISKNFPDSEVELKFGNDMSSIDPILEFTTKELYVEFIFKYVN